MHPRRHALDDPIPGALHDAIARGWRGLTVVTGRDDARPVTLVCAVGPAATSIHTAQLRVGVRAHGDSPVPDRLVMRLAADRPDRTGEGSDPGRGLASAVRWRVRADGSLPRLMSGARFGDPPVLALPAGGASTPTTSGALARMVSRETDDQSVHLARARRTGRLTVADVALGEAPLVTALRTLFLDRE